ncbi:MAG: hypothetical protein HY654_14445, partial [Acidobacteria bacterium]|nr:hypothetical protein [Acidobacteriota bacterium]
LALAALAPTDPRVKNAVAAGIEWLLGLQNRDGGMPTFCRGWGMLPFDRSAPDLTAHALRAWSAWQARLKEPVENAWIDRVSHKVQPGTTTDGRSATAERRSADLQRRVAAAARRAVTYLAHAQNQDDSWSPLWFGNQHVSGEVNFTYGTARVLQGLACELARSLPEAADPLQRGLRWLLRAQNDDGGWGGAPGVPSTIEETGLALQALGAVAAAEPARPEMRDGIERGARWLVNATGEGRHTPASPIGLYFARLWYFEELYPIVFGLGGLSAARDRLRAAD